ncbi:hypothetical protein ACTFIU_011189 [Dictyostelium citrinum]
MSTTANNQETSSSTEAAIILAVVIVSPVVGVVADPTTSVDQQVVSHQVATLSSLQTVPTTVFRRTRIWKELGLPSFCQEVVSGLKVYVLPNFKAVHNPIPISIPEGPKSECITKEVQDLLVDDAIEQVLPNQYSKLVFYSNVFTVLKPGTNLHRQVLDLKRLNTFITNQSFKMEGIKKLPSMVKQGYYMVKLDIKKAYLHVLVDPHYRDLFPFVWKGVHYQWKTMPFGLSTAHRIFTMLLRPVLRMLRELNVSVIAYLDDLLIVGSTKEECLSNLDKKMKLLVKLGFKLNLEKSILEPTQSITFLGLQIDSVSMQLLVPKEKKKSVIKEIRNFLKLYSCSPRKLAGLKRKLIALKDAVIPFRLYTRKTNKFHCHCLSLSKGDRDQLFVIPQDVKSEISNWLTLLTQWNGKEISLFPGYHYLLFLKNQTDIAHAPCITRIMTGIHKLRPSSAKYNEIWDANRVFRYLANVNIYPKFTYSSLLNKTLVLCKMFGLARSFYLVKWYFIALKVTPDSIKGPVINDKEQRNTKSS